MELEFFAFFNPFSEPTPEFRRNSNLEMMNLIESQMPTNEVQSKNQAPTINQPTVQTNWHERTKFFVPAHNSRPEMGTPIKHTHTHLFCAPKLQNWQNNVTRPPHYFAQNLQYSIALCTLDVVMWHARIRFVGDGRGKRLFVSLCVCVMCAADRLIVR